MPTTEIYKRYSEAFKRQVVTEYEQGASASALSRKYGIGAINTVITWVKRYSHEGLRHETIHIQTSEEATQVQQLQQEISVLRQALAEVTVQKLLLEGRVKVYQETYGESVLKKNGRTSSSMLTKPEMEP